MYVNALFSTSNPVKVPLYNVSSVGVIDCAFATGTSLTALIFTLMVAGVLTKLPSLTVKAKESDPVALRLGV